MSEIEEERVLEYLENVNKERSIFTISYHTQVPEKRLHEILTKLKKEGRVRGRGKLWSFKSVGRPRTDEEDKKPKDAWKTAPATKGRLKMITDAMYGLRTGPEMVNDFCSAQGVKSAGELNGEKAMTLYEQLKAAGNPKRRSHDLFREQILALMADGKVWSPKQLAETGNILYGDVTVGLSWLKKYGKVENVGYGKWKRVVKEEPPDEPEAEEAAPVLVQVEETPTIRERVLVLMDDGTVRTPTQISEELDIKRNRIGRRLTDMVRAHELSKAGHGEYKKYEAPPPEPAVTLNLKLNLNVDAEFDSLEAFERGMNCLAMGARYLREVGKP